jgi:hypothetical protein
MSRERTFGDDNTFGAPIRTRGASPGARRTPVRGADASRGTGGPPSGSERETPLRNIDERGELRVDIHRVGTRWSEGHKYWIDERWEAVKRAIIAWAILTGYDYEVEVCLVGPNVPVEQRGKHVLAAVVRANGDWEDKL